MFIHELLSSPPDAEALKACNEANIFVRTRCIMLVGASEERNSKIVAVHQSPLQLKLVQLFAGLSRPWKKALASAAGHAWHF